MDHGVCFSVDPKLRTVLWAWRGTPIEPAELAVLAKLRADLDADLGATLDGLLEPEEVDRTRARLDELLATDGSRSRRRTGRPSPGRRTDGYQRLVERGTAGVWSTGTIRGTVDDHAGEWEVPIQFEAYTTDGVRRGIATGDARLGDIIEVEREIEVTQGHIAPLDGTPDRGPIARRHAADRRPVRRRGPARHPGARPSGLARRHPRRRAVPRHRRMPTMPGFDPARALARPTGSFVLLDHVKLSLASEPDGGSIEHELAWVNRYVVERVESDLELGFFFPGAESIIVQDTYTPGAGLDPALTKPAPEAAPAAAALRRPARTPSRPRATRPPEPRAPTRPAGQTGGG